MRAFDAIADRRRPNLVRLLLPWRAMHIMASGGALPLMRWHLGDGPRGVDYAVPRPLDISALALGRTLSPNVAEGGSLSLRVLKSWDPRCISL